MNQVECHPYLDQRELLAYCEANQILMTAYSPIGSSDRTKELKAENEPTLLEEPVINKIAKAHQATPAQVLISWGLIRKISLIPKSVNAERITQNFRATQLELCEEEMK